MARPSSKCKPPPTPPYQGESHTLTTRSNKSAFPWAISNGASQRPDLSTPARHAPRALPALVEKSPGHDPALFLPLRHLYRPAVQHTGLFQRAINAGQAGRLRDQRGEPQTAAAKLRALLDHAAHESLLAPLTPQLRALPAEIQNRRFLPRGILAKILPFALRACIGFGLRRMERRIAQGEVEHLIRPHHAGEDRGPGCLQTQFDG